MRAGMLTLALAVLAPESTPAPTSDALFDFTGRALCGLDLF